MIRRRLAMAVAMAALALSAGGCAVLGFTVNKLLPPPKVPAQYRLPPHDKLLILVDDVHNPVSYVELKRHLTDRIAERLIEHDVTDDVVAYEQVLRLASATPDFYRLEVREIARRLGADLILYVNITRFSVRDDESIPMWKGRLVTSVMVRDVDEGLLWPKAERLGRKMPEVETRETDESRFGYGETVVRELADKMGRNIAELFYKHPQHTDD